VRVVAGIKAPRPTPSVTFPSSAPTTTPTTAPTTTAPTTPPPPTSAPPKAAAWKAYTKYKVGDLVTYEGVTYRVKEAHTALPGWEPTALPDLFAKV